MLDTTTTAEAAEMSRQARRLGMWARIVLVPVAVIGAVLSYQSLYKAAEPTFGPYLAAGFPLLVDLLILGASLQYVAGAKVGRAMNGWRLTAHCGVAGTLVLNALAAKELGEVPWHITAPAVWAVLVELTGKQVLGQWKAAHHRAGTSIAPSLWLSAPIESARTRLLMARTGVADATQARIGVGMAAAAREALSLSLPRRVNARRDAKRVRRVVNRQLRAGSLPPAAVLGAVGWNGDLSGDLSPESILRAVVQTILRPASGAVEGPAGPVVGLSDEVRPDPGSDARLDAGLDEAEVRTEQAVIANALRERHPGWPAETIEATAEGMAAGEALPTPAPRIVAATTPAGATSTTATATTRTTAATKAPRPRAGGRSNAEKARDMKARYPKRTNADIAQRLGVTERTVERYLSPATTSTATTSTVPAPTAQDADGAQAA